MVRQRLSRLAPDAAAAVEIAAVAGRQFELSVLAEAAGLEGHALVCAVESAVRNGLFEELPEPAGSCRFTHELVRRAIYDRITVIRRAELHLLVGQALERVHGPESARVLPELAHHFTLAVPVIGSRQATAYNLRLADDDMAAAAYETAAGTLRTALELGITDPEERARAEIDLSYSLAETGHVSEAEAVLAESLNAARGAGERGVAGHALMNRLGARLADPLLDLEAQQRGFAEVGQRVAAAAELRENPNFKGLAWGGLAEIFRKAGKSSEAAMALGMALSHYESKGNVAAAAALLAAAAKA